MSRNVVISGLGPASGLGIGIEPTWEALVAGRGAVDRIKAFDPSGFPCQVAAEIGDFSVSKHVPKWYRKATKVMARDIELAVAAADHAYEGRRIGCHIGAGLIATELNELTSALATSRNGSGAFDIRHWGREGMQNLYPLWLLKYLPNMLACHVTIIHDAQGPSNTITCGDSSATLSIGESMRVIQRGAADVCFCGGLESKVNPMAFMRQWLAGRLTREGNDDPARAVRPFCRSAGGSALGEGGAIVVLESQETFTARRSQSPELAGYARLIGFGASQTFNPASRNRLPDPEGDGIAQAIDCALADAGAEPDQIDLIVPFGMAMPECDRAEAAALRRIFGARLVDIPLAPVIAMAGNCCAGVGALGACVAALALRHQTVPARINCETPLDGLRAGTAPSAAAELRNALVVTTGMGGQNAALVLGRLES
jgi:3-oxoacyl-[acyl-carrier-protein] synthase II